MRPHTRALRPRRYRKNWLTSSTSGRPIWVPATVEALVGDPRDPAAASVRVKLLLVNPASEIEVPAREVLPMNRLTNKDDMAVFEHLHEAAILYNCQVRATLAGCPCACAGAW